MRVLTHPIYEYEKGLRHLVLHTLPAREETEALHRPITFHLERVSKDRINILFGDPDGVAVILRIARKPLHPLTPEEDFRLGTLLGYGRMPKVKRSLKRRDLAAAC